MSLQLTKFCEPLQVRVAPCDEHIVRNDGQRPHRPPEEWTDTHRMDGSDRGGPHSTRMSIYMNGTDQVCFAKMYLRRVPVINKW